ncbi:MAG: hypothetical protein QOH88_3315 [Verrucomicrobiota bacterium]|jgi:hypothetical protein
MNASLQKINGTKSLSDPRRFIGGLRQALDLNHNRMLAVAKREWERRYAGKDPSDACVTVRITSGEPKKRALASAGILKKKKNRLLA